VRIRCTDVRQLAKTSLEQLVAPVEEKIPEQKRSRATEYFGRAGPGAIPMDRLESLVSGGESSTGIRVVHDVVVDERGRVEDLEGGRRTDDGGEFPVPDVVRISRGILVADRVPAPVAEQRPESFASAEQFA
jgi:hypothetical protein